MQLGSIVDLAHLHFQNLQCILGSFKVSKEINNEKHFIQRLFIDLYCRGHFGPGLGHGKEKVFVRASFEFQ